jgi:uncharacterized repeat protein (TIGR01451 family)
MNKIILFMLALIAPAAAMAAQDVSLSSEVFVEKTVNDAGGTKIVREKPSVVTPGDALVFVLSYANKGAEAASGFVVTNPVPASVGFTAVEGKEASVSVDGGKSWGQLAALTVAQADGTRRAATAADVTHIRWSFSQPIAAGSGGTLSFRGTVK